VVSDHGQAWVGRAVVVAAAALVAAACGGDGRVDEAGGDPGRGEQLFAANCATCHGPEATGTTTGPPLVHEYYVPSHHADVAFHLAVQRGVQPHHWGFGPMPPVPGLDEGDVTDIIAYVRGLQRDAGIIE
jgi:mono/diheme cytochrome c family protein